MLAKKIRGLLQVNDARTGVITELLAVYVINYSELLLKVHFSPLR